MCNETPLSSSNCSISSIGRGPFSLLIANLIASLHSLLVANLGEGGGGGARGLAGGFGGGSLDSLTGPGLGLAWGGAVRLVEPISGEAEA
jgi:hypothetical protein